MAIMEAAPQARVVTQYIGFARLETAFELDPKRMWMVNPGGRLDVGDRELAFLRPPVFDSPATSAVYDPTTEILFSADSFGAFIPQVGQDVADIPEADFQQGFGIFNYANHPWTLLVDRAKYETELDVIRRLDPAIIASCHSPLARGRTAAHLDALAKIPDTEPMSGPDQEAFEAMFAALEGQGGSA